MNQVLINLIMNSIHAMPNGGNVQIVLRQDEDMAKLTIADTGQGIRTDVLSKIFDPFFTTKRGAGGTGLGLFVIYNIVVKQFGGSISCDSEPGQGTIFTIQFPIQGK